jgi:hypothetical protein
MFLSTNESMQKLSLLLVDNNKNNVIELAITKTLLLLPNQIDLVSPGKHIFAVELNGQISSIRKTRLNAN